jgi:hypothetical protein
LADRVILMAELQMTRGARFVLDGSEDHVS